MAEKPYVYETLPEKCYCHTPGCGFVLEKPTTHCRDLACPKCGAPLWRSPPEHSSTDPYKVYQSLIKPPEEKKPKKEKEKASKGEKGST